MIQVEDFIIVHFLALMFHNNMEDQNITTKSMKPFPVSKTMWKKENEGFRRSHFLLPHISHSLSIILKY
ncbi:unnamed protein product [Brassica rapa subsp. trilocularis]